MKLVNIDNNVLKFVFFVPFKTKSLSYRLDFVHNLYVQPHRIYKFNIIFINKFVASVSLQLTK